MNYNGGELLQKCLSSIELHPPSCDFEAIVVDNMSIDGSENVCMQYSFVKLIRNKKNVGFAAGNNQAFELARGNVVLMLNADTEVHPGAFDNLVEYSRCNPNCGLVSAKLLNPDGTPQIGFNVRRFPTLMSTFAQLFLLDELVPKNRITLNAGCYELNYDKVQEVEQPAASALLINREALTEVRGFDTNFVNWYNDVDLCKRVHDKGWRVVYLPSAQFLHHGGRGTGFRPAKNLVCESYRSLRLYFYKHHGFFAYLAISVLTVLGMILRVVSLSLPTTINHKKVNVRNYKSRSELIGVFGTVASDTVKTLFNLPINRQVVPNEAG